MNICSNLRGRVKGENLNKKGKQGCRPLTYDIQNEKGNPNNEIYTTANKLAEKG
jgi:hypothetical protein